MRDTHHEKPFKLFLSCEFYAALLDQAVIFIDDEHCVGAIGDQITQLTNFHQLVLEADLVQVPLILDFHLFVQYYD